METQTVEQKQLYLREKIIDTGYDAEQFVEYCTNEHNLASLEEWSMDKLIHVVDQFILSKKGSYSEHKQNLDDDWTDFEDGSKKNSHHVEHKEQPHNATKNGELIFSEADWNVFLGASNNATDPLNQNNQGSVPSPSPTKKSDFHSPTAQNQSNNSDDGKIIEYLKAKDSPLKGQSQVRIDHLESLDIKENPLSPPSKNIKDAAISSAEKTINKGPINFTNIKLSVTSSRPLPELPQINDIVITKTEQIARNFLQSDYTLYHIKFCPGQHSIQRKFSDFRKLRGILRTLYPHIRLPYLEPEGWITSSEGKDSEMLAKYKWMIVDFLKYTLKHEELQNCAIVRKFSGYSTSIKSKDPYQQVSKSQLKKMLENAELTLKPKSIGQLCLKQNCIILPPSDSGERYINNTTNVMTEIDHEYERLKKKFQTVFYNYDILAKSLADVSMTFESLENLIKKYNYENDESKEFRVYDGIRQMCTKMQQAINDQYICLKSKVKNIFRYEKDNMMTLKEIFETRSKIHAEFIKHGESSLSKSSQKGGELQVDSGISLEEPCRNNKNTLAVQEIFWSHFTKTEVRKYWEDLRKKINEQLTMIAYQELDNENDNLNFWNSMIKKCVV